MIVQITTESLKTISGESAFDLVTKNNTFCVGGREFETRIGVLMDNYEI
jgi:hypothetical protein